MRETTHYPLMKRVQDDLSTGYDCQVVRIGVTRWLGQWIDRVEDGSQQQALLLDLIGDIDGPVLERKA